MSAPLRAGAPDGKSFPRRPASTTGLELAVAFALGLAIAAGIDSLAPPEVTPPRLATVTLAVAAAGALAARERRRPALAAIARWLLFFSLGLLRAPAATPDEGAPLSRREGAPVRLVGTVADVPVPVGSPSEPGGLPLAPSERPRVLFGIACGKHRLRGRVESATLRDLRELEPGRRIEVRGRWYPPHQRRNPGDPRFRGPPLVVAPDPRCVRIGNRVPIGGFEGLLLAARGRVHHVLSRAFRQPTRGLLLSLLVGDRRALEREVRDCLTKTGTFHYLAISGLHVGVVVLLLARLPLPRGSRTIARLGLLALFALLTGGAAPVVRATVMATIHLGCVRLGRRVDPLNSLGWTALLLLAVDPALLGDIGFQLSITAVAAILSWGRELADAARTRRDPFVPPSLARRRPGRLHRLLFPLHCWLAVSLAASVATAPLIALAFERVHPLGPLWSVLFFPAVVAIFLGGGAVVVVGLVVPPLADLLAVPVDAVARSFLWLAREAATVPGSCWSVPPPHPWQLLLVAALLIGGRCRLARRPIRLALAGAATLALALALLGAPSPSPPRLWVFDVGDAAATLLKRPAGGSVLVDAGGRDPGAGARLRRALLATRTRRLAAIFLTHPDSDHVVALEELLRSLNIGALWISPRFEDSPAGRAVAREARGAGVDVHHLSRGEVLEFPGDPPLRVEALHPAAEPDPLLAGRDNEASLCLRLREGMATVLLPGDIEEKGIARLLGAIPAPEARLLILPHHGHPCRLLSRLVAAVRPERVIASGSGALGAREVLARIARTGTRTSATWREGAISLRATGNRWEPVRWREE